MTIPKYTMRPYMDKRIRNLCGQRFGRLLVIGYAGRTVSRTQSKSTWLCRCDCGTWKIIAGRDISKSRNPTTSCGCVFRELNRVRAPRGRKATSDSYSVEYAAYHSAKARCENPNDKSYDRYGAKGIQFLFESYTQFLEVLGRKPSPQHSLDRYPDPFGNYSPTNCRWGTWVEQGRNRRKHRWIIAFGKIQRLSEWVEEYNVPRTRITQRLDDGWCSECSITIPALGGTCPHKISSPSSSLVCRSYDSPSEN